MIEPDANRYFGEPWNANIAQQEQAPTPIGEPCLHCGESIQFGDQGLLMHEQPMHVECLLRNVIGSVGHQERRCACYGGTEEDDPALTKREAALAAVEYWEAHQEDVCDECGRSNGEHDPDCEEVIDTVIIDEA